MKKLATVVACTSLFSALSASAGMTESSYISMGEFKATAVAKERGIKIEGSAMLIRTSGKTDAFVQLIGLAPNATYGSHVHNQICATGGGGHYKKDASVADTLKDNEIWPAVSTNAKGIGHGADMVDYVAAPEAQSIVIHDTDGKRLACADLAENASKITTKGGFENTATANARDINIQGSASLVRLASGQTEVALNVSGLKGNTSYGTHVHNLPCSLGGGSHYKIDTAVGKTVASNEIWPLIKTNGSGSATASASAGHISRPEAQSIVIHDTDGARLACAALI